MFGEMNVIALVDLCHAPEAVGGSVDGAIARLLEVTEHPKIEKWVQLPKALLVFLVVPGDPSSGAFYVYDRHSRVWFWLEFADENFGGYTIGDFESLVRDCRFLDLIERPRLLAGKNRWVVRPGFRPQRRKEVPETGMNNPPKGERRNPCPPEFAVSPIKTIH